MTTDKLHRKFREFGLALTPVPVEDSSNEWRCDEFGTTVVEAYFHEGDDYIWVDVYGLQERCCNAEEINISFSLPLPALVAFLAENGYQLTKKETLGP